MQHFGYKFEYWVRRRAPREGLNGGLRRGSQFSAVQLRGAFTGLSEAFEESVLVQARNVDINKPIRPLPPAAQRLLQRLEQLLGVHFDQLTVNEYNAGVGLSSHVDTHSAFSGGCFLQINASLLPQ